MSQPGYDEAVTAWAAHLRSGGTTTWSAWLAGPGSQAPPSPPTTPPDRPVPDAIHLELVRRLNERGSDPLLSDLVLATGTSGRGRVDVPLPWLEAPHRFGTPALEPGDLPAEELLRLAVSVLARLLPGVPHERTRSPHPRWPLPGRTRFRLHGSPRTVAEVRALLVSQGLVESDWRPVHLVLGRPVEVMLGEHWAAGARRGGSVGLGAVWHRAQGADRLPRPVDLPLIAGGLSGRAREPVHVVLGRDHAHVAHLAASLLGAREHPAPPGATAGPTVAGGAPDPTTADLQRRVNRLLALTAGPERVPELTATLGRVVLAGVPRPAAAYPVPVRARGWAQELARTTAAHLQGADYAVHGLLDDLAPDRRAPRGLDPEHTLDLALTACLRAWQLQGGT